MKIHTRFLQYVLCIVCLLSSFTVQPMQSIQSTVRLPSWVPRSIQELTLTQKVIGTALMTMALMYAAVRARSVWYKPMPSTTGTMPQKSRPQKPPLPAPANVNASGKKAPSGPSTDVAPELPSIRREIQPARQIAPKQSFAMNNSDSVIKQRTAEMIGDALFNFLLKGSTSDAIPGFDQPNFISIKRLFTIIKLNHNNLIKELITDVQNFPSDFSWPRGLSMLLGMINPSFEQITIPKDIANLNEPNTKDKKCAPEYLNYWLDLDISPLYEASSVVQQDSRSKFFHDVKNMDYGNDRVRLSETFHLYREAKRLSKQALLNPQIKQSLEEYGNQLKHFLLNTPKNNRVPIYIPDAKELQQKQADLEVLKKAIASHAQN